MIKAILREVCIMLLLCVAIVLILGLIFYDYIPSNKIVPNKMEAYQTPENVKEVIEEVDIGLDLNAEAPLVYTINGKDLNRYEATNSFVTGKSNPFSPSILNNEAGDVNTPTGENTTGENTTGGTTTVDPNSTGTLFEEPGLK